VVEVAHRLGVTSDLDAVPSIALGSSEVTPLEMVSAYAAFANGGLGVQPHVIARVRTANGKQLYARRNANFGRVIDPQYVAMMNQMMQETLLTGTARKAELPGWQAAGKTGTSQDWRDAWFLGYTSYLVAGVWLGNDDSSPTKKVSGGNLPVEIWSRFMKAAHEGVPVAALPLGGWRQGETQNSDASPTPPLNLTGAQLGTGGRGGRATPPAPPPEAFAPQPRTVGPRGAGPAQDGGLLPPAEIPNGGRAGSARDKGLLDKLFGTL
jgi:penicillin-binding protein 1A